MATYAEQIQLIIEAKTTYEGGYFPNTQNVDAVGEAASSGKFHVIQLTDKAETGDNRKGYRFLITMRHSSQANIETMTDTLYKCNTMSGNATYSYKPSTSGYPYFIEFYGDKDWSDANNFFASIECLGWWSF